MALEKVTRQRKVAEKGHEVGRHGVTLALHRGQGVNRTLDEYDPRFLATCQRSAYCTSLSSVFYFYIEFTVVNICNK